MSHQQTFIVGIAPVDLPVYAQAVREYGSDMLVIEPPGTMHNIPAGHSSLHTTDLAPDDMTRFWGVLDVIEADRQFEALAPVRQIRPVWTPRPARR